MSMPLKRSKRLLKKLPKIIIEKLATRPPDDKRPVLLFAQDEGRFGRISDVRRAWSPPGTRPQAPRQVIRTYLYVFTAVCPALGRMTSLILPWANTEMMNIFLQQVAEDFSDYFIFMLADQAGWHCPAPIMRSICNVRVPFLSWVRLHNTRVWAFMI